MPGKDNAQSYPYRKENIAFYAEKLLVGLFRRVTTFPAFRSHQAM